MLAILTLFMSQETGVHMNVVENIELFKSDVRHGHWDVVLKQVAHLRLPDASVMDLYEQV
jgi:hypothetical protein